MTINHTGILTGLFIQRSIYRIVRMTNIKYNSVKIDRLGYSLIFIINTMDILFKGTYEVLRYTAN